MHAPNTHSEYGPFFDQLIAGLEGTPRTHSILLLTDFSGHLGNDAQTCQDRHSYTGQTTAALLRRSSLVHNQYIDTWYRFGHLPRQKSLVDLFVLPDHLRKCAWKAEQSSRPITSCSHANCDWSRRVQCKRLAKRHRAEYHGNHCLTKQFAAMSSKDSPGYHRTRPTFKLTSTPRTETYGVKRIGQKRNPCWNDQVRTLLTENKAAYRAWLDRQIPPSPR